MFEAALGTAATFILLFTYVGFRKVAGYAWLVDIGLFALCLWLFQGTYAGMMTGMISGLVITLFLKSIRRCFGYEKLALLRKRGELLPKLYWQQYDPSGKKLAESS